MCSWRSARPFFSFADPKYESLGVQPVSLYPLQATRAAPDAQMGCKVQ